MNFQSKVEPCFAEIRDSLKAWLDDFLLYGTSEERLLSTLETFLKICRKRRLKISIRKSTFFCRTVKWCGRVIDKDGVHFDPRHLSGILDCETPRTAGELCQYVNCMQWMSNTIPDFATRVAPLREVLERAYAMKGSRKKRSIQSLPLSRLSWDEQHVRAFTSLQDQLQRAVKIAHRDPSQTLCIYTDASEMNWGAVVSQCPNPDLDKPIEEQVHTALAFLSAAFKDTESRWTMFEKEAYPIYQVFRRMDYLLMTEDNVRLYTDHRNLLFVFSPHTFEPNLGRAAMNKVLRWALYLSRFAYVIEHVAGEKNIFADMISRWYKGYRGRRMTLRRLKEIVLEKDIVESPSSDHFTRPSTKMVLEAQRLHGMQNHADVEENPEGLRLVNGKIWVPNAAVELQWKLLVVAHCGKGGHRGQESTLGKLKEEFCWNGMEDDCREFVAPCIHCIMSKSGNRVPRPLALTLHASRPNEVVHFDFLYLGPGEGGLKYVLVVRDDLSSYLWLKPAFAADAKTVARELSRWIRTFTVMSFWVSDQASHFKNQVMRHMAEMHGIRHKLTVAYSPWVNGTVESCMRHILAACRALLSELKLAPHDWPRVVGVVQTALNEAPLRRLDTKGDGVFLTPLEVMTGIAPTRTMLSDMPVDVEAGRMELSLVRALQVLDIKRLQNALTDMHKTVKDNVTKNRKKQIRFHNKKTNIVAPNFSVGDFVLVRRPQQKGHKLTFRWIGPQRITGVVGDMVYDVSSIVDDSTERVHAARLLLYRADLDSTEVSQELLNLAERSEARYEIVEKIMDIGEDEDWIFLQVQWQGLPDKIDWTWRRLLEMHEDMPEAVQEYLANCKKKRLARKAQETLKME